MTVGIGIGNDSAAVLAKAQKTIRELTTSREILTQELASKEASFQILLSDMEARRSEEVASANDPVQLPGHQLNCLETDEAKTARLERDLQSARDGAAAGKEQAERALSSMFARLARDRATHERERQKLQHKLLEVSQELVQRRALDKLHLEQANKVRELWREVMSAVPPLQPGDREQSEKHDAANSNSSSKVTKALMELQGPLLDLMEEIECSTRPLPSHLRVAEQGALRHAVGRSSLPSAVQQGALEWALCSEEDGLTGLRQRLAQLRHAIRGADISEDYGASPGGGVGGDLNSPSSNTGRRRPLTWASAGGAALRDESESAQAGFHNSDTRASTNDEFIDTAYAHGGCSQQQDRSQSSAADTSEHAHGVPTSSPSVSATVVPGERSGAGAGKTPEDTAGGQARAELELDSSLAAVALLQSWTSFGRNASNGKLPMPPGHGGPDVFLSEKVATPGGGSWFQTRLRLVVDDEMGKLFEVAVRRKVGGRSDGGGVEQVEEQVVRGMVEDHEVTASGDVLYLRGVVLAPPRRLQLSSPAQAAPGQESPCKSAPRRQLGQDAWSPTVAAPPRILLKVDQEEDDVVEGEGDGRARKAGMQRRGISGAGPSAPEGIGAESSFMFARAGGQGVLDLIFLPSASSTDSPVDLAVLEAWVVGGNLRNKDDHLIYYV